MKIADKFKKGSTIFSLEVFPPKKDSSPDSVYKCLDEVKKLSPDFVSVTYGAAGNPSYSGRSAEIASYIQNMGITASMHLTCIAATKPQILGIMGDLKSRGIENVLALRGDLPSDIPENTVQSDFKYASDLAAFISQNGNFGISGACYPEMHNEAASYAEDIRHLKIKVESGVSHLISQLFFDNNLFYDFLEKLDIAGINVPVEAGIMPVTNAAQITRMVALCGASIPQKLSRIMNRYADNPVALRDAGISYAVDQISDLIAAGVDGIHLYAMNNAENATRIHEMVKSQLHTSHE
jgi:methylenetetrahydrofolate reductase (NADPH)